MRHRSTSVYALGAGEETPLGIWLRKRGISAFSFARSVGADAKQVRSWCNGQALPGLLYAFKIDQLTEGGVPPESWLGTGIAKLRWREMGVDADALAEQRREVDRRRDAKRT